MPKTDHRASLKKGMLAAALFVATSFSLVLPSTAVAYRLWLEADQSVETLQVGDAVSVDLFLDTADETRTLALSVGVFFDPGVMSYVQTSSSTNPYPLYRPSGGKGDPARFLEPLSPTPTPWPVHSNQVNVDFISSQFHRPDAAVGVASDRELLATLVFEKSGQGDAGLLLAFGAGNIVTLDDDPTDFPSIDFTDLVALGDPIGVTSSDWIRYCTPSGQGHPVSPCIYDPDQPGNYGGPALPGGDDEGGGTGDPGAGDDQGGGDDSGAGDGLGGGMVGSDSPPGGGPTSAVPEPTAALLFGAGIVLLFGRRSGPEARS